MTNPPSHLALSGPRGQHVAAHRPTTVATTLKVKRTLATLLITTVLYPVAAPAKASRCVIRQDETITYSGACTFHPEQDGSFSIHLDHGKPILPNITTLTVSLISPGAAEVRGLTTDGINSRWGPAQRGQRDPACWTGADFEICAY